MRHRSQRWLQLLLSPEFTAPHLLDDAGRAPLPPPLHGLPQSRAVRDPHPVAPPCGLDEPGSTQPAGRGGDGRGGRQDTLVGGCNRRGGGHQGGVHGLDDEPSSIQPTRMGGGRGGERGKVAVPSLQDGGRQVAVAGVP